MNKKRFIYWLMLFSFSFCLYEWFLFFYTWFLGYINGGQVTISVNFYNEAIPELIALPIATVLVVIGFIYFLRYVYHNERFEKQSLLDEYLDENIRKHEFNKRFYLIYGLLGGLIGFFISQVFVMVSEFSRIYIGPFHFQHFYIGMLGFIILLVVFFHLKGLKVIDIAMFVLFMGGFLGVAIHDAFFEIINGNWIFFL